jgi:hypothetical protein
MKFARIIKFAIILLMLSMTLNRRALKSRVKKEIKYYVFTVSKILRYEYVAMNVAHTPDYLENVALVLREPGDSDEDLVYYIILKNNNKSFFPGLQEVKRDLYQPTGYILLYELTVPKKQNNRTGDVFYLEDITYNIKFYRFENIKAYEYPGTDAVIQKLIKSIMPKRLSLAIT